MDKTRRRTLKAQRYLDDRGQFVLFGRLVRSIQSGLYDALDAMDVDQVEAHGTLACIVDATPAVFVAKAE